ncbi:MAG TPA: hypothetical protein VIQ30_16100 [Pseudonocardia sp.]
MAHAFSRCSGRPNHRPKCRDRRDDDDDCDRRRQHHKKHRKHDRSCD